MNTAKTNRTVFGVVIKVNDLDLCRTFYRDILGFGDPSVDSSFAVRFTPADNFHLVLEKVSAPFLEHASAATAWSFECTDVKALSDRIESCGYAALVPLRGSRRTGLYLGRDPENNVFFVKDRSAAEE